MPPLIYLWVIRPIQIQDTVFMNDFAQFLCKNRNTFRNIILHINTDNTPEETYFQAKRISGFLSEHLVANTVFHLHQWGLINRYEDTYVLNSEKLSKVLELSPAIVLTNIWKENVLDLQKIITILQKIPILKGFIFANNPHLNIQTQLYEEIIQFPDETETAELFSKMNPLLNTWVSHLNNISKII